MLNSTTIKLLPLLLWPPAILAVNVASGTFLWPTTTGNFTPVTGLTFQPKVLIVSYQPRDTGAGGAFDFGMGIALGPTSRVAMHVRASDGSLNADGTHTPNRVLRIINASAGDIAAGDFVSFNADGFTLNAISVSTTVTSRVYWLALGGNDLTNASLVQYQAPTVTGSQALTGAGFQPDGAILLTAGITTAPPSTVSDGDTFPGLGFASSSAQKALGLAVTHTVNTERRSQDTGKIVSIPDISAMRWEANVTSFDADGITLNWTTVQATGIYFWVLYLKGINITAVNFNQATTTGNMSYSGLTTYQVKGAMFASFCNVAATGQQNNANVSVSFHESGYTWSAARSGNNNSSKANGTSILACYTENSTTPTLNSEASFVSWDATGFTVNWTTTDANARQYIGLLFGDGGTPPPPSAKRRVIIE